MGKLLVGPDFANAGMRACISTVRKLAGIVSISRPRTLLCHSLLFYHEGACLVVNDAEKLNAAANFAWAKRAAAQNFRLKPAASGEVYFAKNSLDRVIGSTYWPSL